MANPQELRRRLSRCWVYTLIAGLCAVLPTESWAESVPDRIQLEPGAIRLEGARARQQVAVTGHFADGSVCDLTAAARFTIEPEPVANVSPTGVVTPRYDGEARLVVEAATQRAEVPVLVAHAQEQRPISYRLDVAALFSKAGCNMGACHGNLNGKGGFKLSLRGDDPSFDLPSLTRDTFARRTNLNQPEQSLIYSKPTGQVAHEGGQRFSPASPEAATLLGWIRGGGTDDVASAPKVVRLRVFPPQRIAPAPALAQQLVVTAEFSDGTRRDVTRQASYDVSEPIKVSVSTDGRVQVSTPCEVTVAVRYLNARGVSRLAFLADRPNFAWHGPPEHNVIDRHVFGKLKALRINPSEPATDAVFVRRAYLDAIGLLPSPEEARAFLADTDPEKRAKLIDRLIARPEFADFWALKWADLLRNEEKTMGEKGVWVFQRWLRDQIARDVPLDEFARRIVSSRGSTWKNPPTSFYRTNRDPMSAAETVGQVFLGVRLQCARCHNHPFDVWTQNDYYGLAAFFGNIAHKEVNNFRRDNLDSHEINGDEMIYLVGRPEARQPRSGEMMQPKPLGGPHPELGPDPNALDDLADWLTRNNPQFARNMVNRIWFHLLGRGIVDPVDDFRDSNPPSNPALLDALTDAFAAHEMRLRPMVVMIMKSQTYQLGSRPNDTNADDEANFARGSVRLLPAEVLLDSIGDAVGKPEAFSNAPRSVRAVQLPGAALGSPFLKVFGKPDRLLTCECERSEATTLAQAFQLINGEAVRQKLEADDNRIGRLLTAGASEPEILVELYLATLSREPTDQERASALQHIGKAADRRKAWEDVAWAIVNSKEFLLRH
ncbi:MAG TPA: DUF1549 and DUF1553 domain-containing protein [Isosphaeraceae bacterium]|nr:DUF1549 and DUF1553 domain-containing protein [Isosphaeraceae bacterium]